MALKFYTSVAKGLQLKVRQFLGLNPRFVEVTGKKLVRRGGRAFSHPHPKSKQCYIKVDLFQLLRLHLPQLCKYGCKDINSMTLVCDGDVNK